MQLNTSIVHFLDLILKYRVSAKYNLPKLSRDAEDTCPPRRGANLKHCEPCWVVPLKRAGLSSGRRGSVLLRDVGSLLSCCRRSVLTRRL